jgi:NADPH2:quinone reductase
LRAVQIQQFGGPEVLELADLPVPEPGDGQALIRVSRAGINFADTHTRENSYLAEQQLPLVPGAEVAGTVERGASGLAEGQRAVALLSSGGYAEYAVAPADFTFPVPDGVDDATALALVLQGVTAWHLYRTSSQLRPGETVVVHAAAGGVGTLAIQLAKPMGAGRVIATASAEDKRNLALELGADAAVDPNEEDLAGALRAANDGRRVDVVLEMAGGRVFDQSLAALGPFGRLVAYGMASREQRQISNARLLRGSLGVVGFWLAHCFRRPGEMLAAPLDDLFQRAAAGELRVIVGETYPLSDVRRAHEDLQARRTTGKLLLDPAT